ncbi:hypothetical protein N2152v2_000857 [Parachlorella kessleri]
MCAPAEREALAGVQVVDLELLKNNNKYQVELTDGKDTLTGVLATQVGSMAARGELQKHGIIKVTAGALNMTASGLRLVVTGCEVLGIHEGHIGGAAAAVKKEAKDEAMQDADPVTAQAAQEDATTPGPREKQPLQEQPREEGTAAAAEARTPAAALKSGGSRATPHNPYTPAAHPTPPSAAWKPSGAAASQRACQPIAALNPYNNQWTIKAKVVSKGTKRSFSRGASSQSVFSCELVDEQGTTIEATFWRDGADRFFDAMEDGKGMLLCDGADRFYDAMDDGKVYLLSGGSVKPANKKFSSVRNDYTLHFDEKAHVEECSDDIDSTKMQAKMEFVPIDQLANYADKKMTVDVIGVVTQVAPLGSVKRKSDSVELSRRDMTLVDQSLKTVVVTLWGSAAEVTGLEVEAAAADSPVVAISACRVSSYNGVSVSALTRSAVLLNPELPEAAALRSWYESSGRGQATQHVGEGLESAIKRGAPSSQQQRSTLQSVRDAAPASADDKPSYSTVTAAFVQIDTKQLYYMACPENNRKVVEADGGYLCEYDGKVYPTMTRRYILGAKLADESGELYVQVFNDQAEVLLGSKADDLAQVREHESTRFAAVMRERVWQEYVLRVKAQAQEYNGETRVRYAVADIKPVNYAQESRRLLDLISAGRAA